MIPLKPDGTLDIEKFDNLSSEQYLRVLESMTQEQYEYYSDHGPVNEGHNKPTKAIKVKYFGRSMRKGSFS